MVLPFRNNPFMWSEAGRWKNFFPVGRPQIVSVGARSNPIKENLTKKYGPTWTARFLVGLSVGGVDTYSLDHLISLTRKFLSYKGLKQDSSFVAQRGVYTYEKGKRRGRIVEENSAQVILIWNGAPSLKVFTGEKGFCVKMAEYLCKAMKQETIIVDIQKSGVSQSVWSVCA